MSTCILIPACCEQVFVYGSNENYPPPVVQDDILFVPEGAFSYNIIASNYPLTFGATNLPAGLSVNSATGQIVGSLSTPGQYIVGLSAYNGIATGTGTLTINVVAIPVVSNGVVTISPGSSFFFQIEATNHPFKYGALDLPAGVQFNASTGVVSGVPQNTGTTSIPISATNVSGVGSATLTLTVAVPYNFVAYVTYATSGTLTQNLFQISLDNGAFFTPSAGTNYTFGNNIRAQHQATSSSGIAEANIDVFVNRYFSIGAPPPILLAGSTLATSLSGTNITSGYTASAVSPDSSPGENLLIDISTVGAFSQSINYTYPANATMRDAYATAFSDIFAETINGLATSSCNLTFQ